MEGREGRITWVIEELGGKWSNWEMSRWPRHGLEG